ncbi:hypothetical protein F5Y12DRAFT_718570 [Xylaria sp. FL1777]|nr:hypothetical protein F5Y12DRAFT_718570 [Xylaria sp. FL1777]
MSGFTSLLMRSIGTIGGPKVVEFTDKLANHLQLVDDDTAVLLFHHASFLECQVRLGHASIIQDCNNSDWSSTLYPDGLVDETLRTLALLFLQPEFSSSAWGSNKKRE